MKREEFNKCVQGGLTGRKFPDQAARRMEFCVLAKMCSKNLDRSEATRICSQPKPAKPPGIRKRRSRQAPPEYAGVLPKCPTPDYSALIPHCEEVLAKELPTDEGINPVRICQKIFKV